MNDPVISQAGKEVEWKEKKMLKIQRHLNFICKFSELAYLLLVEVSKFLMAIPHKEEE